MVIVRPSLLKLAMSETLAATTTSADPLFSWNLAEGMILLSKVRTGDPGATTASCLNIMRRVPGSVAIIGLTGPVKLITNFGGVVFVTWADDDADRAALAAAGLPLLAANDRMAAYGPCTPHPGHATR